jgi:DNA primase catalytic core
LLHNTNDRNIRGVGYVTGRNNTISDKARILERLTVVDVYGHPKQVGKDYVMKCPFHEEKTASFHIYTDSLSFKCYGCNKAGSVFDFVMETARISFPEALRILAEKAGVELSSAPDPNARLLEINSTAFGFYAESLKKNEKAMEYLTKGRSLLPESIQHFKIGCTNVLPLVNYLKNKGFTDEEIINSGLGVKRNGEIKDFFFRRIMFPITRNGRVLGFSGRVTGDEEPKYLNTSATPIFRKKEILYGLDPVAIKTAGYAIVVEGQLDVIMAHQCGYRNTCAPLGTSFGEEHVKTLKKYINWAMVIYDGDKAGINASQRTAKILFDGKMRGGVGILPEGEDPDSFLRRGGTFMPIIESAEPFPCFLADRFKGTKRMIFNTLLIDRSSPEIAEFLAYRRTKEETDMFREIEARALLEKDLKKDPLVVRRKDMEVRKHNGALVLLAGGRFLFSTGINGEDYKKQAEYLVTNILKLKNKARRRMAAQMESGEA